MATKITGRLQTPTDENGQRKDIHLITTTDEVIVNPESANPVTLTERLDQISSIVIKGSKPAYPCVWANTSVKAEDLQ